MPPGIPRRGRASTLARAGGIAGLVIYLALPLAAAMPRSGRNGAMDRAPGIVLARCREAQADVTGDRPLPRPETLALAPARVPAVVSPGPADCAATGAGALAGASPPRERLSRSPPAA
jgi:hypothetical protein